jgi:hypothetical protein
MENYQRRSWDASRVGRAAEYLVASSCILASRAELNVSTSMVDDEGVDIVFHRRNGTATLGVQVKSRTLKTKRLQRGQFMAEVRSQTFRPRDDLYVLFVVLDAENATFGPTWLVPSKIYHKLALRTGKEKLRISTSLKPKSKSRWRPYRLERGDLAERLLEILDGLERRPKATRQSRVSEPKSKRSTRSPRARRGSARRNRSTRAS